jgi:hypothetical protein
VVACPLVPSVPYLLSGSCPLPRTFVLRCLQTLPHGDALALPWSFGSTTTWTGDFHPQATACTAHAHTQRRGRHRLQPPAAPPSKESPLYPRPLPWVVRLSVINVSTVSNADDFNDECRRHHAIDDAIITYSDTLGMFSTNRLPYTARVWLCGELFNRLENSSHDLSGEFLEFLCGRTLPFNAIGVHRALIQPATYRGKCAALHAVQLPPQGLRCLREVLGIPGWVR